MARSVEDVKDEVVIEDEERQEDEAEADPEYDRDDDPGCTVEGGVVRLG